MSDDGEIRGEESVWGERGGRGWVGEGDASWVTERDEIRNLDDGGVKAGSEIGMGDSKTRKKTDGQRDRRPNEEEKKGPRQQQPHQQQRQRLLIAESGWQSSAVAARILSEVVSVCQARSRRH